MSPGLSAALKCPLESTSAATQVVTLAMVHNLTEPRYARTGQDFPAEGPPQAVVNTCPITLVGVSVEAPEDALGEFKAAPWPKQPVAARETRSKHGTRRFMLIRPYTQ